MAESPSLVLLIVGILYSIVQFVRNVMENRTKRESNRIEQEKVTIEQEKADIERERVNIESSKLRAERDRQFTIFFEDSMRRLNFLDGDNRKLHEELDKVKNLYRDERDLRVSEAHRANNAERLLLELTARHEALRTEYDGLKDSYTELERRIEAIEAR